MHPNPVMRPEVSKQFARFVRALRPKLAPHVPNILASLNVRTRLHVDAAYVQYC